MNRRGRESLCEYEWMVGQKDSNSSDWSAFGRSIDQSLAFMYRGREEKRKRERKRDEEGLMKVVQCVSA